MGLIDLQLTRISERKALNDWRHYCNLARLVALNWARLQHIAVLDAYEALRKTD